MVDFSKLYDHKEVEKKWYLEWLNDGLFESTPNPLKEPYTVVMPPPNITGILHMGHVLNNSIQDVLVRKERMSGKEACWVPGLDHASIATEAKVVSMLKERGINKSDLTRDQFLQHVWEWNEKHRSIIIDQLKRLGISCDWSRLKFTMDTNMSKAVEEVFINLYEGGYIYRASRMINWDPKGKTALSDDEVIYKEVDAKLFYLRYLIDGEDGYVTVATSRPETIMADAAICINPNDDRYDFIKGKRLIIPLVNKVVPVIEDGYVDITFGSGCLKITPAHDLNDYNIAQKHKLEFIDILNDDGTINHNSPLYRGLTVSETRCKIVDDLKQGGFLINVESYKTKIGFSERTDAVVEPRLSTQWFVKTKDLASPALDSVNSGKIKFHPSKFCNIYRSWLENIKDWCISRQLWWGHRIPAYYLPDGNFVVARSKEDALIKAKDDYGYNELTVDDLIQDEDVLDTWFSAWLWPISVFDGILNPNNDDIDYYYPTNDVVTAPEIIFFWISRMIMAGCKFMNDVPFNNVYFTGIVKDQQGRKMSKSLGNSPDPIDLIDLYGADSVRFGVMLSANAGNDLLFDVDTCIQGKKFVNKIWNALRLISNWSVDDKLECKHKASISWFNSKFNNTLSKINNDFYNFRISAALMSIYKLFWDDFCSSYLEMIKPVANKQVDKFTYDSTIDFFKLLMKVLHPFMPFITEEAWNILTKDDIENYITVSPWPVEGAIDKDIIEYGDLVLELINKVRKIRVDNNISNKIALGLYAKDNFDWLIMFSSYIERVANITFDAECHDYSNFVSLDIDQYGFLINLGKEVDFVKEIENCKKEINYLEGFLKSVLIKLNNENFVKNAPSNIINNEKLKKADAENKLRLLKDKLLDLVISEKG